MASEKSNIHYPNVARNERVLSGIAGGALTVFGLTKKNRVPKILLMAAGAVLVDRAIRGHCYVYKSLGISTSRKNRRGVVSVPHGEGIKIEQSVIVNRSPEELFTFWRNFENLPRIMEHLESVEILDASHSRWRAKAPAGTTVEWEAVIHNEIPNQLIAWRSLENSEVDHAGSVEFKPLGERATEVKVVINYRPPAGDLGRALAKLFGEEPSQQIDEDLFKFKSIMEKSSSL